METEKLPRHLEPLLQPTPSGVAKLLAAWDGLLVETQIEILTRLPDLPDYLAKKVGAKSLASETPYIRYLAAKRFFSPQDMEMKAIIESDPDPLVRYSNNENALGMLSNKYTNSPKEFWALPHEARLACVRCLWYGGWEVAKIISYALDNLLKEGHISENELEQVLDDYLFRPTSINSYLKEDLDLEPSDTGELEALWRLVPKLSPYLADGLVRAMPPRLKGFEYIRKEIIEILTDNQLATLLFRSDIVLRDLRRDVFRAAGKDSRLRAAARSSYFSLDDS